MESKKIEAFVAEHAELGYLSSKLDTHVYLVWYDGEVCMQKAGDLLWCRTLHMCSPGMEGRNVSEWLPGRRGEDGYMFVYTHDLADELAALIKE